MKRVIVEDLVFEKFPDFKRGIVYAEEVEIPSENSEIEKLLRNIENERRDSGFLKHPYIEVWDNAHRKFGSNPNKYPPSIKALLKRVVKGKKIPFINCAVAIFNYISLKYLIPSGGDDVDRVKGNLVLGVSDGNEKFLGLGYDEEESPEKGEVIYYDSKTLNVMCRKWNWRNGAFSIITEESKRILINIDGVGAIPEEEVLKARDELGELVSKYCRGEVRKFIINKDKREILL